MENKSGTGFALVYELQSHIKSEYIYTIIFVVLDETGNEVYVANIKNEDRKPEGWRVLLSKAMEKGLSKASYIMFRDTYVNFPDVIEETLIGITHLQNIGKVPLDYPNRNELFERINYYTNAINNYKHRNSSFDSFASLVLAQTALFISLGFKEDSDGKESTIKVLI